MTTPLILSLTLFSLLFINMGEAFSVEINSPEIIVVESSSDKDGEGNVKRDDLLDRLKRGIQDRRRTRPGEGEGAYTPPRPRTQKDHPAH